MTRRTRGAVARLVVVLVLAGTLGACAAPAPSATPGTTAVTTPSAGTTAAPSSTASAGGSASAGASASAARIVVDATLLDVLPATVSGVPVSADAETAAEIAGDPKLATSVDRLALAAAFGPLATGDAGGDYAAASVVHLRPGVYSEAFFREWRDTFDAGVCEQAGGVVGHAEADLGGRTTWIGTCAGDVHTYHAVLRDETVIVSVQSAGEARFGEQIMAGLTE